MPVHAEVSQDVYAQLLKDSIGTPDLSDDKLVDKGSNMATANTCYRSCLHCD
ncbi:hypothetical protein [Luteimonas aquatica]|uniref:hypothetical protein n=1 Tax=Luteimonas aquatica TaxID=450364 RepID=UPI001F58FA76|nr:hypothetical protein [Luteimonas aquatica]